MSRSNTNYYNLCHSWGEIGEDGYRDLHRPLGRWRCNSHKCIPPGEYLTRRGLVKRKPRFPEWTWKSWCSNPPRDFKRAWRRIARARYRAEMAHQPDDPVFSDNEKWISGMYGWWS